MLLLLLLAWLPLGNAARALPDPDAPESGTGSESTAGEALTQEQTDAAIAEGVEHWMAQIDWGTLETALAALPQEVRALWTGYDLRALTRELAGTGTGGAAPANTAERVLLPMLGALAKNEFARLAGVMATLIGLSLVGGLIGALSPDRKDGLQEATGFVCRCFTLTVVLTSFASAAALAVSCIESVCACMELVTPILMTLLVAMGGTVSAGVFQPAMSLLILGVSQSFQAVVLPLVTCGGVLSLVSGLSARVRLNEMGTLCRQAVKWIIGAVTTLYTATTALRGLTAASYDGIAVRTAKYAAGSMFPMVGGLVTGSFDTVLGCAALVKNAAGVTSILLCVSIAAAPVARLASTMLAMRVTAALVQPVAQKEQVAMCRMGAEMLSSLLAACAAVMAMFLVTVGLVVGAGNAGIAG